MKIELGVTAHTFNPYSQEVESGEFEDSLVYITSSKSTKMHNKTFSKGNEKKKRKRKKKGREERGKKKR